jgi:hypothetical protein
MIFKIGVGVNKTLWAELFYGFSLLIPTGAMRSL